MPAKREIIYPVFLECINHTEDTFWQSILEDLAYGKPPHGTYISKGFLACSYKGKEFSYKIERKDPKLLYNEIYTLLKEKIGILSQKEKENKKNIFSEIQKSMKNESACTTKRKNTKDMLYEKYVIDMKKKHNLTIKQAKYLLSIITIGIMFKTISNKDISFSDDNKIEKIHGIDIENGKILFNKPLCCENTILENEPEIKHNFMYENWGIFLEELKNKYK